MLGCSALVRVEAGAALYVQDGLMETNIAHAVRADVLQILLISRNQMTDSHVLGGICINGRDVGYSAHAL